MTRVAGVSAGGTDTGDVRVAITNVRPRTGRAFIPVQHVRNTRAR